ncbi:hypothetical protein BaRGS_00018005 [Batillaria attramentaria]|uniref:Secreted protein n=1 Tax=Batillaria attramentaria TaxID=370345 RepID=A0ABD0KUU6_9CAEN
MTGFRELLLSSVLTSLLLFRSANACDKNATVNCLTALNGTGIDQNTPNVDAVCRLQSTAMKRKGTQKKKTDRKCVMRLRVQKCLNRWTVRHPTVDTARFGRDPDYGPHR